MDALKIIIFQIIVENKWLLTKLEKIRIRDGELPFIEVSFLNSDKYIQTTNTIILSLKDMLVSFRIAKLCKKEMSTRLIINSNYKDFQFRKEKCLGLFVDISRPECGIVQSKMNESQFLKRKPLKESDVLAVYSLAYSLYHEIGHVFFDKEMLLSKQYDKEIAADSFAFEAIKSMQIIEEKDALLLGTIIGIAQVLIHRKPSEEDEDDKHPHSVERLYNLLDYWGIEDGSPYWELVYKIVSKWCKDNNLLVIWEKGTSLTYKDKFFDSYIHFRKKNKQTE
jgi:hypothetical protein